MKPAPPRLRDEVALVLYGERGLHAFELTRASQLLGEDFAGLRAWLEDGIEVLPFAEGFGRLPGILG